MEKAKTFLELTQAESDRVSSLTFPPHRLGSECSFYEYYSLRGIRVDRIEPGQVFCTFKVPPRLTDREGKLASGAIANLVDEVGGAIVFVEGLPMNVSVDMSISFLSSAKADDREGKLAAGAIANLVDAVGAGCVNVGGRPTNVSVDLSISFLSSAKIDDELEIIGKVLGKKGGYSGTSVLVKNKATGELIAEGRHSLFGKYATSKM